MGGQVFDSGQSIGRLIGKSLFVIIKSLKEIKMAHQPPLLPMQKFMFKSNDFQKKNEELA